MKQVELARLANVNPAHLNRILKGVMTPRPELASTLAYLTGTEPSLWVFGPFDTLQDAVRDTDIFDAYERKKQAHDEPPNTDGPQHHRV